MTDLVELAQRLIAMRKDPLRQKARERYPAAAQAFAAGVAACDDPAVLLALIRADTGHVLPPPTMQVAYERLLADEARRTAGLLGAYAMHLTMFGYTAADGSLVHDTDEMVSALYAEIEAEDAE